MQPPINKLISFLSLLFDRGLSHSAINTARAAVISLVSVCTDSNELASSVILKKFMKGVFTKRPALPKYRATWDVNALLKYLEKLSPPKALNLITLSAKLITLLLLLSAQRGQSIHLLCVDDVECTEQQLILRFNHMLKHTRPGVHLDEIILPAFPKVGLCVVTTFMEYIKRTKPLRAGKDEKRLFLTSTKPHKAISRDTASKWIKRMLRSAGINMSMFGSHSVRSAATSAAFLAKVPLNTILKTAGWTNDNTFRIFYNKPVLRNNVFANSILDSHE